MNRVMRLIDAMSRRDFLKRAGTGAVASAVAPSLLGGSQKYWEVNKSGRFLMSPASWDTAKPYMGQVLGQSTKSGIVINSPEKIFIPDELYRDMDRWTRAYLKGFGDPGVPAASYDKLLEIYDEVQHHVNLMLNPNYDVEMAERQAKRRARDRAEFEARTKAMDQNAREYGAEKAKHLAKKKSELEAHKRAKAEHGELMHRFHQRHQARRSRMDYAGGSEDVQGQDYTTLEHLSAKRVIEGVVGPSHEKLAKIMAVFKKALEQAKSYEPPPGSLMYAAELVNEFPFDQYPDVSKDDIIRLETETYAFWACAKKLFDDVPIDDSGLDINVSYNERINFKGQKTSGLGEFTGSYRPKTKNRFDPGKEVMAEIGIKVPHLLGFEGIAKSWPSLVSVVAHELVHDEQSKSLGKKQDTYRAFITTTRQNKNQYKRLKNRSGYNENRWELMAFAKTFVQKMSASGMSKSEIVDTLKAGKGLEFITRPMKHGWKAPIPGKKDVASMAAYREWSKKADVKSVRDLMGVTYNKITQKFYPEDTIPVSHLMSDESKKRMRQYAMAYAQQLPD